MEHLFKLIESLPHVKDILRYYIDNKKDIKYRAFTMSKDYYQEIFSRRLQTTIEKGVIIKGLKDALMKVRDSEVNELVSHSLTIGNNNVLIYTDTEYSEILGIVFPNGVAS